MWLTSDRRSKERATNVFSWRAPVVSAARKSRKARLGFETTAWWSWSDSNQPPKCYGTWFESDQLPWSDTPSGAYVARPTPVKCVTHAETPHWGGGEVRRKAPVSAIDRVCGTTAGAVVPQPYPWGPAHQPFAVIAPGRHPLPAVAVASPY